MYYTFFVPFSFGLSVFVANEPQVAATISAAAQPSPAHMANTGNHQPNPASVPIVANPPKPSAAAENARITPVVPKKLSPIAVASRTPPDSTKISNPGPDILVQSPTTQRVAQPPLGAPAFSAASDENSTQLSSSDGSAKPASLDGKSVASATTFALDEKESLRPDDSASVKATEDEDLYSLPVSAPLDSRTGSEAGAPAFGHQLQEITSMDPSSRPALPAVLDSRATVDDSRLYNPAAPFNPLQSQALIQPATDALGKQSDFPPDQKLVEAINSPRDRIWVLKLEQDIIDFVKDSQ